MDSRDAVPIAPQLLALRFRFRFTLRPNPISH
jgi:hypothetical protein